MEKKPLNHFHPGSSVLSFGTAGCNSGCRFCQNFDIAKARSIDKLSVGASPEKIAQIAASRGIDSVAFTYNDPIVFAEYAIDTAQACRALGIHPIAVTAGYMSAEARPDFYAAMDAANIDLKGFTEDFYWKVTGTHLADVLATIDYAVNEARTPEGEHVWVELTTLLIPGLNDDDAQLHAECTWIGEHLGPDVPLHFSAFHPSYRMMDVPPTPHETLTRTRAIALAEGLHYVYAGNVHDREGVLRIVRTRSAMRSSSSATGTALSPTAYQQAPAATVTARNVAPQSPGDGDETSLQPGHSLASSRSAIENRPYAKIKAGNGTCDDLACRFTRISWNL